MTAPRDPIEAPSHKRRDPAGSTVDWGCVCGARGSHGWHGFALHLQDRLAAPRAEGLDEDELRDTLTIGLTFARMSRGGSGANFLDRFNATRRDFEKKASAALARLSRPSDERDPESEEPR